VNDAAAAAREARTAAARLLAVPALLTAVIIVALAATERWPVERGLVLARASGWLACSTLLLSLAVTPADALARALGRRIHGPFPLPVLRRALGMEAAWLALLHALVGFFGPLRGSAQAVFGSTHLLAGAGALGVLLLLLLTSFAGVVVRLRLRYFKPLHRLAYAAGFLVLQHVLLSPFASRRLAVGALALLCLLLCLRLGMKLNRGRTPRGEPALEALQPMTAPSVGGGDGEPDPAPTPPPSPR